MPIGHLGYTGFVYPTGGYGGTSIDTSGGCGMSSTTARIPNWSDCVQQFTLQPDGSLEPVGVSMAEVKETDPLKEEIDKTDTSNLKDIVLPYTFNMCCVKRIQMVNVMSIERAIMINLVLGVSEHNLMTLNKREHCPDLSLRKEQKIYNVVAPLSGKYKLSVKMKKGRGDKLPEWKDMIIETERGIVIGDIKQISMLCQSTEAIEKNIAQTLLDTDYLMNPIPNELYSLPIPKEVDWDRFVTYLEVTIDKI